MAGLRQPTVNIVELEDDNATLISDLQQWKKRYFDNANTVSPNTPLPTPKSTPDATFDEDPLALSVTSYLIWKSNPSRRWTPVNEVGRPTPEARDMAHEIRRYYLQRNTMKVLMGQQPTEFQYKMNGFLSDIRPLKLDELGLLYRIPYFYQEDLALDKIFEGANQVEIDSPGLYTVTSHTTLTPKCEVLRSRKGSDYIQFWFTNTSGERCVYDVKSDNKLLSVFRSLFKQPELTIKAYAKMEHLKGSHIKTRYWRLSNLELQ
jgi:hypothetical protein